MALLLASPVCCRFRRYVHVPIEGLRTILWTESVLAVRMVINKSVRSLSDSREHSAFAARLAGNKLKSGAGKSNIYEYEFLSAKTHPALASHEQFRPNLVLQIANLPAQRGL